MRIITKEIEERLRRYPLYSQENKGEDALVICKFFLQGWTWYVLEAEKIENEDYLFFGLVDGFEREYGYFTLSQLKEVRGHFGVMVERDAYFKPTSIKDLGL